MVTVIKDLWLNQFSAGRLMLVINIINLSNLGAK
jgi:hypothetical protein